MRRRSWSFGIAHEDGWGSPRNAERAREWYSRAAEAGHETAWRCRESMAGENEIGQDER